MAAASGGRTRSRTKVAIVGGGVGGLTTAFELTRPEHEGRFDVTVYQLGWRLGGKGASGRNLDRANRIEEHGLHVWMGFYENAFRMLRETYAEIAARRADARRPKARRRFPDAPVPPEPFFDDWRDAFFPDPHIAVGSPAPDGTWDAWTAWFPPTPGLPGDPLEGDANPFTLKNYLTRAIVLVRTLMFSTLRSAGEGGTPGQAGARSAIDQALDEGAAEFARLTPRLLIDTLARLLRVGALTTAAGVLQGALILETLLKGRSALPSNRLVILEFVDALAANVRRQLEDVVRIDSRLRRKTEIIDLVMTSIVGILRDDLLFDPDGLDAIDEFDARDWLERHGATHSSLASPILKGLYDMAFADTRVDGRPSGLAAGQALRCALRMFYTYRGALFWRMRSSLADVVFAPMYQLLVARGVRFEFFHRLDAVDLDTSDAENPFVRELVFGRQAQLRKGVAAYAPLVDVTVGGAPDGRRMAAWPSKPDLAQLAPDTDPQRDFESAWDRRSVGAPVRLQAGRDFHMVVLALGLGAIRCLDGNLITQPRWAAMLRHMKTVATQAAQIWMRREMPALGWRDPPVTLSGFEEPFDTWADMTHIVPAEDWGPKPVPRALAYFCGACDDLPHPVDEKEAWAQAKALQSGRLDAQATAKALDAIRRHERAHQARIREQIVTFLDGRIGALWPDALIGTGKDRGFDWSLLVDSARPDEPRHDASAIDSQFWCVALQPSDRYVLTVPGSSVFRISPLDDAIVNLTVAGDWTECGFHGGCIEAAVMSGRLAAHALSGFPALSDIVGFDHP